MLGTVKQMGETHMAQRRMHTDEILADEALAARLVAAQFPQWRGLPVERVRHSGTDNAIFRLGDELVARLPRIHWAAAQADKEFEWLPRLAPYLPLAVPTPLHRGVPAFGYPWPWSVHEWLEGDSALDVDVDDANTATLDLAAFIRALRAVPAHDRPPAVPGGRGGPLSGRDAETRAAIAALAGLIDSEAVAAAWQASLDAPAYDGEPVCVHADLTPGNLIVRDGRLSAVIDFGMLTVGDPACDLTVAWNYLAPPARRVLRDALSVDDAAWLRARGWALSGSLIALPYYMRTNPGIVAQSWRTLREVVADHAISGRG